MVEETRLFYAPHLKIRITTAFFKPIGNTLGQSYKDILGNFFFLN